MRVARRYVVLLEPSYDNNSAEGRARMERLGYVRGLAQAAIAEGGTIIAHQMLTHVTNPLNPTELLVVRPPERSVQPASGWACPSTGLELQRRSDCFWSPGSMLAYPILGGIPVLREEAAILATGLS
jgi:hypothetical protein